MNTIKQFNQDFFSFIQHAPTQYQCVLAMSKILDGAGFTKLEEAATWDLQKNSSYYVIRDHGSIICFTTDSSYPNLPSGGAVAFLGAHTDSPGLKIKPMPLYSAAGLDMLGVEVYGGPILSSWFDRNLSIAGRISWLDDSDHLHTALFDHREPIVFIPSLAIHLDRSREEKINAQNHLPLMFRQGGKEKADFSKWLGKELEKTHPSAREILSFDLFCYDPQPPTFFGAEQEFFSCPRLDNLASCFIGLKALTETPADNRRASFLICNDHEEIGSASLGGADGSFATEIFARLYPDHEMRQRIIHNSMLISMDNAHASHPNYAERSEPHHPIRLNGGPVIKTNSKMRYATNSVTSAKFKLLCGKADMPCQEFVMRSDLPCGSTIGPITSARFGLKTVDVGIPSLGMHSIRETTGYKDIYQIFKVIYSYVSNK